MFENKKGLKYYLVYTIKDFFYNATDIFRIPTANRRKRENIRDHDSFLEEIIHNTVKNSVFMAEVGACVMHPPFLFLVLSTNTMSFIYEKIKKSKKTKLVKKKKNFLRSITTGFCSYILTATLALGHFFVTTKFSSPKYNPYLVNVNVKEVTLTKNNQKYSFYLLGEVHLYNYSSSYYVNKLIEQKNIAVLLSEGVDVSSLNLEPSPKENSSYKIKKSWQNYCEDLLSITYSIIAYGSRHIYEEPSQICYNKGIPVIWLEKPVVNIEIITEQELKTEKKIFLNNSKNVKTTGEVITRIKGREGVPDYMYVVLGLIGAGGILGAPAVYFFSTPARFYGFPDFSNYKIAKYCLADLLEERNKLMAENALHYIFNHPEQVTLVRVGKAHIEGILKEFEKHGEIKVKKIF